MDVIFRRNNIVIPNTASRAELLTATSCTLVIEDQKNGVKGESIHHTCTNVATSLVKALAHLASNILRDFKGNQHTPLSQYKNKKGETKHVCASHINEAIRNLAEATALYQQGFLKKQISSHSLPAGGAMSLKLNGIDRDTIKKCGRWSSETFLVYIHSQVGAFTAGLSTKMDNIIPFFNIAHNVTFTYAVTQA